jgi:ABC-type phosphate transport system substrate-binding protein
MKPEDLQTLGMGQFPLVIGGIVPTVNVDGVQPGQIRFTGSLLADIYLGKVTNWNDPAIAKLNPDLKLLNAAITVVHRADGSGTTFNWVSYLSKVSGKAPNQYARRSQLNQTVTRPSSLLCTSSPKTQPRTKTAIEFFKWALENGQKQANDLDYVPLPESLVTQIENYWKDQFAGIKD